MTSPALVRTHFPDLHRLERQVRSAFAGRGVETSDLRVHDHRSTTGSTHPVERIRVSVSGRRLDLWCKCGGRATNVAHGHRSGVDHEWRAYEQFVLPSGQSHIGYHGSFEDGAMGRCLLFDYRPDAWRIFSADPAAMPAAAQWIGAFHARYVDHHVAWPPRYDRDYHEGWVERALDQVQGAGYAVSYLAGIARGYLSAMTAHQAEAASVIHGEYYPKNVLFEADDGVLPVDWESTAVGLAEIDLASLVAGWPDDVRESCIEAYAAARGLDTRADQLRSRLAVAELYWGFRWLGDQGHIDMLAGTGRKARDRRVVVGELVDEILVCADRGPW